MKRRLKEENVMVIDLSGVKPEEDALVENMGNVIAMLRAMHMWFHAAHHVSYGMPFGGDHFSLYDKIYTGIQEEIDDFIERAIGLSGKQEVACPVGIIGEAHRILKEFPSPAKIEGCEMAEGGRTIVKVYLELLDQVSMNIEDAGQMTRGLDDLIASSASVHEGYYYLLNQRAIKSR